MHIDGVRARSFGAVARAYDDSRPGYPEAALDAALTGAPGRADEQARSRVLDLGAGTGKLTRPLLARGLDVVAVEPDPEMLAVLRERSPDADARPGSAERIPLPDDDVDVVLAGQALHWFDLDRAVPELARVLRPGGVLAGLWNGGDDEVGWVRELGELTVRGRRVPDDPAGGGAAGPRYPGSPWFGEPVEARIAWERPTTVEAHLADLATHSWALLSSPADREALFGVVRGFLSERIADPDGAFVMPMRTIVRRSRLLA
ncbi:class I SAM-dependent methyltransferase [Pseudonocardia sp. NPDC049635]|uniref:class I SAM-dependent methyltransferase n=1 Tax=Pseudonocardia sp. NPDC049635 TaxID=3155506 RepID=UPI0033D51903